MDEHDWLVARFEEHRPHLRGVAYRLLGSLSEAEDSLSGRLDRRGDGVFVHVIGRHVEGAGADLPGQRLAPFIGHSRDHDLGAHLGEPAHGRGAASAAGDDRRIVGQVHKNS
jgi:hypothetical protein